jgi:thiosulfate/3-mercaptopyruvate sulfurtransferase
MLDYLGLPGSAILDGGLEAWLDAGGTLTREIPEFEPSETVTTPDRSLLATADEIVASLDTDGESCAVLDTRGDGEYLMATIPDAAHVDWTRTLDRSGRFLSVEELSSLYEAAGFDPNGENPVVTFCGSGYRAAHSYLVLKALGYPNVKNYVPSWSEWGRRPDLPKVRPNPV